VGRPRHAATYDRDERGIAYRLLGGVTILLGLFFTGAFERLALAGRIVKPFIRPGRRLAGRRCPA
jgi:hypothetical protein